MAEPNGGNTLTWVLCKGVKVHQNSWCEFIPRFFWAAIRVIPLFHWITAKRFPNNRLACVLHVWICVSCHLDRSELQTLVITWWKVSHMTRWCSVGVKSYIFVIRVVVYKIDQYFAFNVPLMMLIEKSNWVVLQQELKKHLQSCVHTVGELKTVAVPSSCTTAWDRKCLGCNSQFDLHIITALIVWKNHRTVCKLRE